MVGVGVNKSMESVNEKSFSSETLLTIAAGGAWDDVRLGDVHEALEWILGEPIEVKYVWNADRVIYERARRKLVKQYPIFDRIDFWISRSECKRPGWIEEKKAALGNDYFILVRGDEVKVSQSHLDLMRHATKSIDLQRNFYCANSGTSQQGSWEELVAMGLARARPAGEDDFIYSVTRAGVKILYGIDIEDDSERIPEFPECQQANINSILVCVLDDGETYSMIQGCRVETLKAEALDLAVHDSDRFSGSADSFKLDSPADLRRLSKYIEDRTDAVVK